jgi:hypothetical protein
MAIRRASSADRDVRGFSDAASWQLTHARETTSTARASAPASG